MAKRLDRRWMVAGGAAAVLAAGVLSVTTGTGRDLVARDAARDAVETSAAAGRDATTAGSGAFGGPSPASTIPAPGDAATAAGTSGGSTAPVAPLPPGVGQASVVKSARIEVQVAEGRFGDAFSRVPSIAAAHGGFVASSASTFGGATDGDAHASGSLVVRVPADRFDALRQELIGLGELRAQELHGIEVGGQLTDLDARLRNLRSQEDAMRLLMQRTQSVGETIEVQRQLGAVREQIEQLSAEQARLRDAVALSTVDVSIAEPGALGGPVEPPSPVLGAFGRAVDGAEAVAGALIVSLGYLLPLTFLAVVAWALVRPVVRGRRHERDAAPAAS